MFLTELFLFFIFYTAQGLTNETHEVLMGIAVSEQMTHSNYKCALHGGHHYSFVDDTRERD